MRLRRHPSFRELSRLVDHAVDERRSKSLRVHLQGCSRCRETLLYIRELGDTARSISHPSPPDDALSRILERRSAGDRVIVPVRSRMPTRHRRTAIGLAAGITGTLLAAALLLLPADDASAGASDLVFDPPNPEAGAMVGVRYTPASFLAGESVLYLRGAFRRAGDPAPRGGLTGGFRIALLPDRRGSYHGELPMPEDVVYGYFAVENEDASEVDSNVGRSWDILAYENGVPRYEALKQRLSVWPDRIELGLATATQMVEHYPEVAEGWLIRFGFESALAGDRQERLIRERHRTRLHRLSKELEADWRALPDNELAALMRYARLLGDEKLAETWQERLRVSASDNQLATAMRLEEQLAIEGSTELFAVYERAWLSSGISNAHRSLDHIVATAFFEAKEAGDPALVERWGRRHMRVRPHSRAQVAVSYGQFPELREQAKAVLREELARLQVPADTRRSLSETRSDARLRDRKEARQLLGALGGILAHEGRYEAAIDTLELVVESGWDSDAVRTLAETYEALGQVAEARTLFWLVLADETDLVARESLQDTIMARLGLREPVDWTAEIAKSELTIAERRIADAGPPMLAPGDPQVWTATGERVALSTLVGDDVTILLFWSGSPTDLSDAQWGSIQDVEDSGFRLVTITPSAPEIVADVLRDRYPSLEVFYDRTFEAARSLKAYGTPYPYVADRDGRYFYAEDLSQSIRLAESLEKATGAKDATT